MALAACRDDAPSYIARLTQSTSVVEAERDGASWRAAAIDDRFGLGDAIRTGAASTARLSLARGGTLSLDPQTLLRFQRNPKRGYDFDVNTGAVVLESADGAIEFETAFGLARLERDGQVRLRAGDDGALQLEVVVGDVVLEAADGQRVALTSGQEIAIDLGGAILEAAPSPATIPPDAGVPADAAPAEPATPGAAVQAAISGRGARVLTDGKWRPLASGPVTAGARVRVRRRTTVELSRGDQRATVAGAAEIVIGGTSGPLLEAARGSVVLHATSEHASIAVPGGTITARARPGGSIAEVGVRKDGAADVQVKRGQVAVDGRGGTETLSAGEAAAITGRGAVDIRYRPPAHADVSIRAGESPVMHDPKPPTAVGVRFDHICPGEGIVEVARRGGFARPDSISSGVGAANVMLGRGRHRYRVTCVGEDDEPKASGAIGVQRDSGKRRLPTRPPHNLLDADGRRYTVLYQNRLPELTLRWQDAPKADRYQLIVDGGGRERSFTADRPRHTLRSGELPEGDYRWWFQAVGGGRSPETPLTIDFDNAAAAAYLRDVSPTDDGGVRVEGAVIEDWSVSVNGAPLQLDKHQRFSADLRPRGDERAIGVRISHRTRGVHYYVVRAGKR